LDSIWDLDSDLNSDSDLDSEVSSKRSLDFWVGTSL
jgi:hypothetical protein